jgi:hypothetical protein
MVPAGPDHRQHPADDEEEEDDVLGRREGPGNGPEEVPGGEEGPLAETSKVPGTTTSAPSR